MNVLVYADEGTSLESVKHTTECLRFHLSPHYAVATVSQQQLLNDPWMPFTKLLVIPGGADLPYCRALNGLGNKRIQEFVKRGGKFLGICAGAYYAASEIEFEPGTPLEVSGPRELALYKGIARGAVYPGFCYGSDVGARAVPLKGDAAAMDGLEATVYFNGGCKLEGDAEAEVVARYSELEGSPAAIVYKKIGQGDVLLTGAHFEYELDPKTLHSRDIDPKVVHTLYAAREQRRKFVKYLLSTKLGLTTSEGAAPPLSTLYLSSLNTIPEIGAVSPTVKQFLENMQPLMEGDLLSDTNDTFNLGTEAVENAKKLVVFEDGTPPMRETPFFNHKIYFNELQRCIAESSGSTAGSLGALLCYGEVVTSTSTMLERNPKILSRMPNGAVVFGSQQVQGRGRGGNVWVNPIGVMAVSGVLRIAQSQCRQSLVFIQYLCSLALVEAVNSFVTKDIGLRIKWPNDVYLALETGPAKVSGVIVSCHVFANDFVIVFGSGSNIDNPTPTVSINSRIADLKAGPQIKIESLLARFLSKLGVMIQNFLVSGFSVYEEAYLKNWMHSGSRVFLERYGNVKATVMGISKETGMLVAIGDDGEKYELQPDGNSFDMMRGLIKRKE